MRILAVGASHGGVAHVFAHAMGGLRDAGEQVKIVTIPAGRRPAWAALAAVLRARRAVRGADVIHVEFGSNDVAPFWFGLAVSLVRANVVAVVHDHPKVVNHPAASLLARRGRLGRALAYRVLPRLLDGRLRRSLIRRSAVVLVFGEPARDAMLLAGARDARVIPHGADVGDVEPFPPSRGGPVLFAGFMGPSKGIDTLLRAWRMVESEVQLELVLAGELGEPWFSEAVRPLIGGRRPPRILGAIADETGFQRLIASAAIVVLPYRYSSPASGILVRALCAGRPVIVTPMPAMRSIVDGVNGIVVAPDDPEALAAAIVRLCGSSQERDRLGAAARATAQEQFSWTGHLAGLRDAYRSACDGR